MSGLATENTHTKLLDDPISLCLVGTMYTRIKKAKFEFEYLQNQQESSNGETLNTEFWRSNYWKNLDLDNILNQCGYGMEMTCR